MSQPIKQICDLYDSGKSMSDISDILFISVSTIFRCLKNHPKRTPTDGLRLYQTNRCIPLTESEQKLIYGSLLGDSSLSKRIDGKNTRFHCSHGLKQKDYIAHKYKILNNSRLNCYTQHSGYNKGSKYWRLGYDNFIYLNEIYAITHRNGTDIA